MPLPLLALGLTGASALAGLLGNRKQETKSSWNKTDNVNMLSSPEYDEPTLDFRNNLMRRYLGAAQEDDTPFWNSYQQNAFNDIDQATLQGGNAVDSFLTSRGINRTTAGANAFSGVDMQGRMAKAGITSSIPLLADQRRRELSGQMSQFLSSLPVAQRQTGTNTSSGTGTNINEGNPMGGGLTGLASSLAMIYGASNKTKSNPSGL